MSEDAPNGQRIDSKSRLTIIKDKLLLPEDFDRQFQSGKLPQIDVLGCTAMSLSRLMDDINGVNLAEDHWIQTFPRITRKKGVFPIRKTITEYLSGEDVLPLIRSNRHFYGWQKGIREVLDEHPEAARIIFAKKGYAPILSLGRNYSKFAPIVDEDGLRKLIEVSNTWPHAKISPEEITQTMRLLEALGSIADIDMVLAQASKRQGVQVIYGGDKTENILKTLFTPAGEAWDGGIIHGRIPISNATAILPLGQYEQEKLMDNSRVMSSNPSAPIV